MKNRVFVFPAQSGHEEWRMRAERKEMAIRSILPNSPICQAGTLTRQVRTPGLTPRDIGPAAGAWAGKTLNMVFLRSLAMVFFFFLVSCALGSVARSSYSRIGSKHPGKNDAYCDERSRSSCSQFRVDKDQRGLCVRDAIPEDFSRKIVDILPSYADRSAAPYEKTPSRVGHTHTHTACRIFIQFHSVTVIDSS